MTETDPCMCFFNPETGYFEPCCEEHEKDYVEYLCNQRNKEEYGKESV